MSSIKVDDPKGILRKGWSALVGDYAIAGGWARRGKLLVVGDATGGLYAFEGNSGKTVWDQQNLHGSGLLTMAVHPDGEVFATAGQDGKVLIWSAKDGQVINTLDYGRGWIDNVSWSSDGQRFAVSISRIVVVYNNDYDELWRSEDHPSTVSAIAWAGNNELATACYGRVSFFDASTGEVGQKLEWKGSLVSMVLSPDGDIVACGSQDNSVHFWRRSTGQDSMIHGYSCKPTDLVFDHTGIFLATGGSEVILVWGFQGDGPEGTEPGELSFHDDPISALNFSPQRRRLASGCRKGAVIVWSIKSDGDGGIVGGAVLKNGISELLWRPDGRGLVALDASGGVTAWRVRD